MCVHCYTCVNSTPRRAELCNMIAFPFFYPQVFSLGPLIISSFSLLLNLLLSLILCFPPSLPWMYNSPPCSPALQPPVTCIWSGEVCAETCVLLLHPGLVPEVAAQLSSRDCFLLTLGFLGEQNINNILEGKWILSKLSPCHC